MKGDLHTTDSRSQGSQRQRQCCTYVCGCDSGCIHMMSVRMFVRFPENDSEVESGSNLPGTTNMTRPA
eukprot:2554821-Pyramimonas_sp.AAC.2